MRGRLGPGWICAAALVFAACAKPVDTGDRLYREGDLRGALEFWREADDPELAPRIAAVEAELGARVEGYLVRARRLESEGRLAESILDYRISLEMQPDDSETLDHVQQLVRTLVAKRRSAQERYRAVRGRGDLRGAREILAELRRLDPFEPAYETEDRRLGAALAAERRRRLARIRERQKAEVESLVEAGRAAFGEEELETALDLWRRALWMDPENERLQAYVGRAERQLEALEQLRAEPEDDG